MNEFDHKVYQLRIYICGISPMIWRRILVLSNNTIADLHYIIQIAFGWSDYHLHQFKIKGKKYGIAYAGGISFMDNPRKIPLKRFCFKCGDKFLYEYNFIDNWEHEIRVEKVFSYNESKIYPLCISGKRTVPPENCGGPWSFMELKQKYSKYHIASRLLEIYEEDHDEDEFEYINEEIEQFHYWLNLDQFDKSPVNKWLSLYGSGNSGWREAFEEVVG